MRVRPGHRPAAPAGGRVALTRVGVRVAFFRYVDQGGGKRKGAFAMYCEPWHADIFDWL